MIGRLAEAARSDKPVLRIRAAPRLAQFLIAAGARPVPVDDTAVDLPTPERSAVLEQIRQWVESLGGDICEGSGADFALDNLIRSWTERWLTSVHREYARHSAEILFRRARTQQRLAQANSIAEHERETLDHVRSDSTASARRIAAQVQRVVKADAQKDLARTVLDKWDGELKREERRRDAALLGLEALGGEAANYARVLMAANPRDQAKTGPSATGPAPIPSILTSAGPTTAPDMRDTSSPVVGLEARAEALDQSPVLLAERPAGPVRYSDRDRRRDYRRGRADGRRHLPLVSRLPAFATDTADIAVPVPSGEEPDQTPGPASPTPFLTELFHLRNKDLAALYVLYQPERNQLLIALDEADGRRQQLVADQAAAREELEKLAQLLTDHEAARTTRGEIVAGHPAELIERRRTREREEQRRTAQQRLDAINNKLRETAMATAQARAALTVNLSETRAVGMELVSYYDQRKASYLSGLAHTHRHNVEWLERLALLDPGLPTWLTQDQPAFAR
jgi:hypothetical protein